MKIKSKFKQTEIGRIPNEWTIRELDELGEIKTGKGTKKIEIGNFPILGSNGLLGYTDEFLEDEDLIFTGRVGTIGKINYQKKQKVWLSDNVLYFKTKKIELLKYVYYFLRNVDFSYLNVGSTQPLVKQSDFKKIKIAIPEEHEIAPITKILSNLDSKIELNQRINENIDQIVYAVFKHWFVDFEFPDAHDKPYKSSGGEMIHSEFGDMPKGWFLKAFGQVADMRRGFSYSGSEKTNMNGDYVFVTLNNIVEGGGFKPEFSWITSDRLKEHHFLSEMDLIIANTHFGVGGSNVARLLGCPALVFFPHNYTKGTGIFSHHITKIISFNSDMKYFLYLFLKLTHKETASVYRTGTSVAGLDVNNFMKKCFVVEPPKSILEKFNSIVKPLFIKFALNYKEITVLTHLRDSLLPKLMSGKIRVPAQVN